MWIILEIVKDPELFQAVREEVSTACTFDPVSHQQKLRAEAIPTLPLLQSIFIEILRLHVNFNLMRGVNEPVRFDGVDMPVGSLIQAPMIVAHLDESVWARPEHPASEFWAERHIKSVDGSRTFSMAGRPSAFFPFGKYHYSPLRDLFGMDFVTEFQMMWSLLPLPIVVSCQAQNES